jgi:PAS domain S-box-containing protein
MEQPVNETNLLLEVFPYSVVIDQSFSVKSVGVSLAKISGDILGSNYLDNFVVERPHLGEVNFISIVAHPNDSFYIKHKESGLLFRGQFRLVQQGAYLIFLSSLWVMNIEQLKPYKINISDFPAYDPSFDYLHVLKQSEIHKNELSDLIKKIDKQSAALNKSNAELKEAKRQLESILNEMSDVVWSVSVPDYKMLFVTPSVVSLYGISIDQWMEDSTWWQRGIHPEDVGVIQEIFDHLEAKGKYNVKYRIITPSGSVKWVKNKGKLVFDEQHNPIRLDGVVQDRTAQYLAQESLNQEHRLQEALIDIASTYINLNPKDVKNTINKSLEKMGLFVSADRAYIFDYDFTTETTSNTYEWCQSGISPEIDNLQEVPMAYFPQWVDRHKHNQPFYVPDVNALDDEEDGGLKSILAPQGIKSLIAIPMLDGDELIGFVGFDSVLTHHDYTSKEQRLLFLFGQMLINIRNRQKWENQLRLQEEKYRNIIANMNLGLLEVDLEDRILYANHGFCEMSGYAVEELIGNISSDFIPDDKHKNRLDALPGTYEISIPNKQGHSCWWLVSESPHYNDKGQLIGNIDIFLDLTRQKEMELKLEEAKSMAELAAKAKELFLANMSHEIRTPLNVIIGMIRQLGKEELSQEQLFYVNHSDSAAKHLLTILNNVLDIAKIESGEMEVIQSPFSPSALAYNVHSILHSQAKEKGIDFKLNVSPKIKPVLMGDEIRLRQVLINLLGNSIKFTERGSVNLSVELVEEYNTHQTLCFEVSDTGIGMSPAFVAKIFDKFSQEHYSSNRKYEGTGLGMAISSDLIKLMGGEMKVVSAKHQGTVCSFILSLPLGDPNALVAKGSNVNAMSYAGLKVLLVEDNLMNRFIAMQSLDFLGFETIEAENGEMAIEKIKKESFDLILMDIQMPIMDGVEATRIIREELKVSTPIIALTANAFKHDIDLYLSKGMNDFITKPYDEQDFFRKVEHVLRLFKSNPQHQDGLDPLVHGPNELKDALYDLDQIEKMSHGNPQFVHKMIGIFVQLARENVSIMQRAMEQEDITTLKQTAHKIKPSIDQMGIHSLKEVVRKVEKYDLDYGSKEELTSLVRNLCAVLIEVSDKLEA